jgi:hypothetical protein
VWSSIPWKSAVAVVAINVGFAVVVRHVLHTPGYAVTGRLPALLPWTLAINTSFCALILILAWRANWQQRLNQVLYSSVVVSALPFFLPRALRLPKTERLHALGLMYAVFLLSLAFVAFFYAWANAHMASRRSLRVWILSASMLVYAGTTSWMRLSSEVAGDEPHYLLLSHSLVYDHDFDLSNNYAHQDYRAYFPHPMAPQTVPGLNGMAMLWHDVGLPLLIAPGYWWIGWTGAMLTVNLVTSLLALGIFEAAVELGATSVAGVLAWGLFAFSAPLMIYNSQLYPETAGGAGALWAVILFSRFVQEGQRVLLWAVGILLALLPWLCIRYWMYVGPLLVVIAFYIFMHNRRRKVGNLLALALPLGLSLALFAWFDARHFGTVLPNAGYLRVAAFYPQYTHIQPLRGLLGLLFDRLQGVIPIAPIYLWALAGLLCGLKKAGWPVAALTAASWSYLVFMAFSQSWPGGHCPPARYALGAVVLWAPAAALVLRPSKQGWLFGAVFFWSAFAAVAYTGLSEVRYPHRRDVATSQLGILVRMHFKFDFDVVFPSLIRNMGGDQILAAIWAFLSIGCVWLLNPDLKRRSDEDSFFRGR